MSEITRYSEFKYDAGLYADQAMVRCKSGGCGMWGNPMSLDKWQKRANN